VSRDSRFHPLGHSPQVHLGGRLARQQLVHHRRAPGCGLHSLGQKLAAAGGAHRSASQLEAGQIGHREARIAVEWLHRVEIGE